MKHLLHSQNHRSFMLFVFALVWILLYGIIVTRLFSYYAHNTIPFRWDPADNLANALDYQKFMQRNPWNQLNNLYYFYPPLAYILFSIFLTVTSLTTSRISVLLFNITLVIISCFVIAPLIVLLGKTSKGFKLIALGGISIFFLLYFPVTTFLLDLPMALASLLCFETTLSMFDSNISTMCWIIYSLLFSCIFAIVLLFRTNGITIVLPLFMMISLYLITTKQFIKICFLIISVISTTIITCQWYVIHFQKLIKDIAFYATYEAHTTDYPGLFRTGVSYLSSMTIESIPFIAIIIIILWNYYKKMHQLATVRISIHEVFTKIYASTILYVGLSFIIMVFFISAIPTQPTDRYILPVTALFLYWLFVKIQTIHLNNFAIGLLFSAPLMLLYITFSLPSPDTRLYPIEYLQHYVTIHIPPHISYFFEDDDETFNYANVRLFQNMNPSVQYTYLNTNDPVLTNTQIHSCNVDNVEQNDIIVVFHGIPKQHRHADFYQTCGSNLSCIQIATYSLDTMRGINLLRCNRIRI